MLCKAVWVFTNGESCCRGFTKYAREDYKLWKKEGRLTHDGVNAKLNSNHGRLSAKVAEGINVFETPAMDKKVPLHGGA